MLKHLLAWPGISFFFCCRMIVLSREGQMRTCTFGFNVHMCCEKYDLPLLASESLSPFLTPGVKHYSAVNKIVSILQTSNNDCG